MGPTRKGQSSCRRLPRWDMSLENDVSSFSCLVSSLRSDLQDAAWGRRALMHSAPTLGSGSPRGAHWPPILR